MSLDSVIDREYVPLDKDMKLGDLVHSLSKTRGGLLPVLDKAGNLLGEVDMNKLRHIVFRTELYSHFLVSQLMTQPQTRLRLGDPMEDVMAAFDKYHAEQLPVMDSDNHLIGYVSRAHIYTQYRDMVADLSTE